MPILEPLMEPKALFMSLLKLLIRCISLLVLTCAWVMTDVVRRVGRNRAGAGLMVTEAHIMFVLVVGDQVLT